MTAMMAGKAGQQPVLDHPRGAIGTLETVPAIAAQGQRREPPAVEEQQRLLARLDVRFNFSNERRREPFAGQRRVLRKVDGGEVGQACLHMPLGQRDLVVAPDLDHVTRLDGGRGARHDDGEAFEMPPHHRDVAGVILDPVLLLEARLVRFVDDDQTEVGVGQEQARPRADHDLGAPVRDRAPCAPALRGALARMPGNGGSAEALLEPL